MQYEWAEDDFDLPPGVYPLVHSEPVNNRRYVMYHGTTKSNAQLIQKNGFHQSEDGMLGRGVYLSRDLKKASRYPIGHPEYDKVVIKVVVDVGKVIAINSQRHPYRMTWHDHGFDTAWVPPNCGMVKSGLEEDCVWDPKRIKISNTIKPRPVQHYGGYGSPSSHSCRCECGMLLEHCCGCGSHHKCQCECGMFLQHCCGCGSHPLYCRLCGSHPQHCCRCGSRPQHYGGYGAWGYK